MNILITGAAGFIGYHVMRALSRDNIVIGIDNFSHSSLAPIKIEYEYESISSLDKFITYGDVRYNDTLPEFIDWSDIVIHLAGINSIDNSIDTPYETLDVNLIGTTNILENAKRFSKKVIYLSSGTVYGAAKEVGSEESQKLVPTSIYSAVAIAAENLCWTYYYVYGVDISVLRAFNVFGSYQRNDVTGSVVSRIVDALLKEQKIYIYGDGLQAKDFVSVDQVVDSIGLILRNDYYGYPINVGSGVSTAIIDLVSMLKSITNCSSDIVHMAPRMGDIKMMRADTLQSKQLGISFNRDLTYYLQKYVDWVKSTNKG